jgi:hypothetical protein
MTIFQECIDDLLMCGCEDLSSAAWVASRVREVGGVKSSDEIRELSFKLIEYLVSNGLVELGYNDCAGPRDPDFTGERIGFHKWNLANEDSLNRMKREWLALGRNPDMWDICWLRNTPAGNAIGEELLKQREKNLPPKSSSTNKDN